MWEEAKCVVRPPMIKTLLNNFKLPTYEVGPQFETAFRSYLLKNWSQMLESYVFQGFTQ